MLSWPSSCKWWVVVVVCGGDGAWWWLVVVAAAAVAVVGWATWSRSSASSSARSRLVSFAHSLSSRRPSCHSTPRPRPRVPPSDMVVVITKEAGKVPIFKVS